MGRSLLVIVFVVSILLSNIPMAAAQFSEAGVEKLRVVVDAPDFTLKELGGGKVFKERFLKMINCIYLGNP